jgi:thermostable 8-oxoguanine DNA glycosylase
MLSSGSAWSKMLENIDVNTGKITCVDNVFCNYDTEYLIKCSPNELTNKLLEIRCGTQYINKQMPALIENIKKLIKYEKSYGNVDNYYQTLVNENDSYKALITALSNSKSNDKMLQLDIALTCEYLRNVGYNLPKPDRHLCRILGSEYLGLSKNGEAKPFEVIDIINEVSSKINKPATEIDYIIWSYCANGYGEICTKKHKHCDICKLNNICNKGGETK